MIAELTRLLKANLPCAGRKITGEPTIAQDISTDKQVVRLTKPVKDCHLDFTRGSSWKDHVDRKKSTRSRLASRKCGFIFQPAE
jgi:hypothetical protein